MLNIALILQKYKTKKELIKMSLDLKYRPKSFDEVIGNKTIIKTLKSTLVNEERKHTLLFTGTHGTGKTTLARIYANELGACNEDIIEMNCADDNGVETARKIIQATKYKPLSGSKVVVYILDEAHKTTNAFQNGMLKILEESPKHVYFILCTTDPQKLLSTVRSRAAKYKTELPTLSELTKHLKSITTNEHKKVDRSILKLLIEENERVPRDCINTLESIIDLDNEDEQIEIIKNTKSNENVINLCRALLKNEPLQKIQAIVKNLTEEPETVRRIVLGYMGKVMLTPTYERAVMIHECFRDNYYDTGKSGLIRSCIDVYL
jgi:DNA polymerase-3 subunit gamma/tau